MDSMVLFLLNSIALGVGLAMDAFSVSMANGLNDPTMSKRRMLLIAGTFAFFQIIMPLTGWFCVHSIVQYFTAFSHVIPWIALGLLSYIGGKMIYDAKHGESDDTVDGKLTMGTLLLQGIATSIDALSVGFTISDYAFSMALSASLIIGAVTLCICIGGLVIGRKFGMKLAGKASVLGGVILIAIGLEIFLTGVFG